MGACRTGILRACIRHRRNTCQTPAPGQNPSSPRHPPARGFSTSANRSRSIPHGGLDNPIGPATIAPCAGSKNPVLLREAALSEPLPIDVRRATGGAVATARRRYRPPTPSPGRQGRQRFRIELYDMARAFQRAIEAQLETESHFIGGKIHRPQRVQKLHRFRDRRAARKGSGAPAC